MTSEHEPTVRDMFFIVVSICSWALLCITLVSFWGRPFLFELTTHFRHLYVICGLIGSGLLWWAKLRVHAIPAFLAMILNLIPLSGVWLGTAPEASGEASYKIIFCNIFYKNTSHEPLLSLIRSEDPDLVLLVEVSPIWNETMTILKKEFPHSVVEEDDGAFGLAAFSRIPETELSIIHHESNGFPVGLIRLRGKGGPMTMILDHPMAPVGERQIRMRNRHMTETAALAAGTEGAVAVIGDLNATMWSPYFRDLLQDGRLEDGRRGFGLLGTWPAGLPLIRIPIDHVLVREVIVNSLIAGPNVDADHLPLIMELSTAPRE